MAKDTDKPIQNLESERESLKASENKEATKTKPKPEPPKVVGYGQLFKYCTGTEKFLLFVAALMGMSQGALMPVMTVVFGDMSLDFTPNKGKEAIRDAASKSSLTMFYLGLGCLFAAFTGTYIWTYIGKSLSLRVRKLYFQSLISQEIGYYDVTDASKMTTAYVEDLYKFDGGVGDKHHGLFNAYSMTISGFAVGFAKGWWFAVIVTLSFPVMMIGMIGFAIVMQKENDSNKKNYEEAGSCSEQGLSGIKTVKSLCGEDHEVSLYDKTITSARVNGVKFAVLAGISFGFSYFTLMIAYGLNYYIGSVLVDRNVWNHNSASPYNVADIITIFFAVDDRRLRDGPGLASHQGHHPGQGRRRRNLQGHRAQDPRPSRRRRWHQAHRHRRDHRVQERGVHLSIAERRGQQGPQRRGLGDSQRKEGGPRGRDRMRKVHYSPTN
jgi:ATP-binding cassette subfamily B (MDR/TAP) protein 1